MKKCIIALCVSVVLGFLIHFSIPASLITTLFTVVGIMFSVGMSLVVTMSTQNIHNQQAKSMVQDTINDLLKNYIFCFLLMTTIFAVSMFYKIEDADGFQACSFNLSNLNVRFNYALAVLLYAGYSIVYYIYNMRATREQHYKIEQIIEEEIKEEE